MNPVAAQHARIDSFINLVLSQPQNEKPCCFKGCSACCSEALYASNAEADWIIEGMTPEQRQAAAVALGGWLERVAGILPQKMPFAMDYRALRAPCPLLVNGLCSVYARRPFGCRTFFARGNPKDCDLPARAHQRFLELPEAVWHVVGVPVSVNGVLIQDHLGVLLAERLLGIKVFSASRRELTGFQLRRMQANHAAMLCHP